MKKIVVLLSVLLVMMSFTPIYAVDDAEFEANEEHYRALCTQTLTSEDRATCTDFQSYLNKRIENTKNSIEDINNSISEIKDDLAKADQLLAQQMQEIEKAEQEIEYLNQTITAIEGNIAELEVKIAQRLAEIEKVDKIIKDRLVAQQTNLHVNTLINFLFGGRSYTELMRRAYLVDKVTKKEKQQMDDFVVEKKALEDDQEELNRQQVVHQESLENVEVLKQTLEVAKAENEKVIAQYKEEVARLDEQQAILQAQQSVSSQQLETIRSQFVDLDQREEQLRLEAERIAREAEEKRLEAERLAQEQREEEARLAREEADRLEQESQQKEQEADEVAEQQPNIPTQTGSGWSVPVYNSRLSAGAWYYSGGFTGTLHGNVHYGVDFSAPMGQPVISTGPGVVVWAYGSCSAWGYLGNSCGSYGGNQVVTIISMDNKLYALTYNHLQSVALGVGSPVEKGTVVGYVGSSGSSTGPHLHHEIFYLGEMSIEQYLSNWNGSISFTPNGSWMNLSWACENKGNVAPCRINPQQWYGLSVGQRF